MPAWEPAAEFDDYRLLRPLGQGAMGQVYLAHDRLLDRQVAIKFIRAENVTSELRQAFFAEARAIARLSHPNVVAIHRVGEVGQHPYLVCEFIEGESLAVLPRPMPWRRVLTLGVGLARGLAAAHRAGLLHRDLKPANAMLTADGVVKLLDFGIARLSDAPTLRQPAARPPRATPPRPLHAATDTMPSEAVPLAVVASPLPAPTPDLAGTPLYLAPELWRGEPASQHSDVYALGTMLFQLCSGRAPFEGRSPAQLAARARTEAAPLLAACAPGVDPAFAALVDRCLQQEPLGRFDSAQLLTELERLEAGPQAALAEDTPPYCGWRAFEAAQRPLFFGRGDEAREVAARLANGWVTVLGDSASGKTSLIFAGVVPLLEGVTVCRVQANVSPLTALAEALSAPLALTEAHAATSDVRDAPLELGRRLRALGARVLLIIDPLDTWLAHPDDAAAAARALYALAVESHAVSVLATARPDALEALSQLPRLGEHLGRTLFWLRAPHLVARRELVVGPARLAGYAFESTEVVDELVDAAAAPGGLALVESTLTELWARRDRTRQLLTFSAWEQLGGVGGALVLHAEEVLAGLDLERRAAATSLLSSLVSPEGRRQPRRVVELLATAESRRAFDALVAARLVVVRREGLEPTADLVADALVERWPRLRELADREREAKRVVLRLERAREEWERLGRADDALLTAPQLLEVGQLKAPLPNDDARRFVERSRRFRARQRLTRWGLALVLAAAAAVPLKNRYDAQREQRLHHEWSLRARDDAERLSAIALQRRREALAVFDRGDTDDAEALWAHALEAQAAADVALEQATRTAQRELELGESSEVRARLTAAWAARERFARQTARPAEAQTFHQLGALPPPPRVEVQIASRPPARVRWRRLEAGAVEQQAGTTPLTLTTDPGSISVTLDAEGAASATVPVLLEPGDPPRQVEVELPPATAVPEGFVFVPAGDFLYGEASDEGLRRYFLNAEPLHAVHTGRYLIARDETTFAEWVAFLRALPAAERPARTPNVDQMLHGVQLRLEKNDVHLRLTTSSIVREVRWGQPLIFEGRSRRLSVNWGRVPVTGVSFDDAQAYVAWLRASGRVPKARLCTDHEWERAARGADGRRFPHGEALLADDANFDLTYGRVASAFGPDEVGSHPLSRSPFGLNDTSGNVWEWTVDPHHADQVMTRGGSWYQGNVTAQLSNREPSEPSHEDPLLGLRVCADLP